MKRIDSEDRYIDKFGAGKDGWADENLLTGIGGTFFVSTWADHVQEEIASVIEGEGIALNPAAYNQLRTAIQQMDAAVALTALRNTDLVCASSWRRESWGLPGEDVFGLAHDGARRWLAVGDNGLIATSDDMGETWTPRTPAGGFAGRFRGAHYAAGLFVIVGQGAEVQTSPDGVTWTNRNTAAGPELYGVTYDGTGWVAVGSSGGGVGYVITAAAAATSWTVRTAPSFSTLLYACASDGAGVVVAVGDRDSTTLGQVSVSTDHGVTWTSEDAPPLVGTLRAITHADGAFYAGGEGSDIISSAAPTGAFGSSDWTVLRSASEAAAIYGIASPGGGCVIATRGGATSDPADPLIGHTTWRLAPTPTAEGGFCAKYAKGLVMIGLDGGGVLRSQVFGHRLSTV